MNRTRELHRCQARQGLNERKYSERFPDGFLTGLCFVPQYFIRSLRYDRLSHTVMGQISRTNRKVQPYLAAHAFSPYSSHASKLEETALRLQRELILSHDDDMKSPSTAQKCRLLRVYESDDSEALGDWGSSLSSVRAILEIVSLANDTPSRSSNAKRNPTPKPPPPAVIAWATLLADLVKRAKAALSTALSDDGPGSTSESTQHLLELAWLQLDALHAMQQGWKDDAFFAVCTEALVGSQSPERNHNTP